MPREPFTSTRSPARASFATAAAISGTEGKARIRFGSTPAFIAPRSMARENSPAT